MDPNDVAAQQQMGAIAAQRMMCGLSDNPGQFRRDPMLALMNQAQRARKGHADGLSYFEIPF